MEGGGGAQSLAVLVSSHYREGTIFCQTSLPPPCRGPQLSLPWQPKYNIVPSFSLMWNPKDPGLCGEEQTYRKAQKRVEEVNKNFISQQQFYVRGVYDCCRGEEKVTWALCC